MNRDPALFDRWAQGVVRQFRQMREHFGVDRLASVYFGGGTPTALTASSRAIITQWLGDELVPLMGPGAEVTIECNPESTWPDNLRPWVDAGVTRMSLGLQSMDADVLTFLGRLNTPDSNRRVLDLACSLVDEVSFDLIVATPADSLDRFMAGIDEVLQWPVRHASAYLLEIHAATRFGRDLKAGRLTPTPDDDQAAIYEAMAERFATAGLAAYELSNFARPGSEARHNHRYWLREPYLGVGPSAHSNVGAARWAEVRDTASWCASVEEGRAVLEDLEILTRADVLDEQVLLGLRLREGIDGAILKGRESLVDEFCAAGLLQRQGDRVAATTHGWLLLDQLVARLTS